MDHDDLTSSQWDDVISPNSASTYGNFNHGQNLSILNNEFEDLTIGNQNMFGFRDDEDNKQDSEDNYDEESNKLKGEDYDSNDYDGFQDKDNEAELEQLHDLKREELKENRHQLVSELTGGVEDNNLEESVISPKKIKANESLFNEKDSVININKDDESIPQDHLSSPKIPSQLKSSKLYKTPRPRKFNAKINVEHLKESDNVNRNPLGPLGYNSDDSHSFDRSSAYSNSKAEKLLKEADAPLYNIPQQSKEESFVELKKAFPKTNQPEVTQSPQNEQVGTGTKPNGENEVFNKLEISVGDPMKVGDLTNAHIVYTIKTKNKGETPNDFPESDEIVVSRRYKDFRWIYHQLQNNHPGRIIPPPPSKQTYIGRFNENFIENRRLSLEKMLLKICNNQYLNRDADFRMFLISEDFVNESRERERISGSGASTQSSNALDNSTLSNDEGDSTPNIAPTPPSTIMGGNFMSSLFSMSSKVNDPDEYFTNKKEYFDDLESNLRNFYKSLELIGTQRLEMVSVVHELSLAIDELSNLELNKSTSELLGAFSEVQMKIKDNLDRVNLLEQLTLGFTIEEYLRVIGSIKFVLDTRTRIFSQYTTYNQDLTKKEAQLEKLNKKYKLQVDKINSLNFEVESLRKKSQAYEDKFKTISDIIKEELNKFELEKIDDFRNSVEIFIESSIESQKESIELWETFYERQNLASV